MANHSDSDEDDTFVTLGTALEVPDNDEPLKKPVRLEDIQATDGKGRPRFHGAFTGGFSAGYFNSVGSKEGWAPSTFVSSRDKKPEANYGQRPEDFMDEEDMGEYGIAPRKYVTGSQFTSEERKKRLLDEATMVTADSVLPGQSALLQLIVPERITVGVKLLRKMGWKEGQGVGPRLSRKQKQKAGQKMYGCALPPSSDSDDVLDDESVLSDVTFAPKDCAHILLAAKDNTKGLGYRGLDPSKALPSSHINLFEAPRITKGGLRRKGIRGQGFGVGALEDEDQDIYTVDSMSNYDMTMGGGEEDDTFGWTGPSGKRQAKTPVDYVGTLLDGFTLSGKKLVQKKDFHPPKLPRDFRPVHRFKRKEESQNILSTQSSEGVDYRKFLGTGDDSQGTLAGSQTQTSGSSTQTAGSSSQTAGSLAKPSDERNRYKDASARSLALGEKAFVGSVFDLISEESKDKMEKAKQGTSVESAPSTSSAVVPILDNASQNTDSPGTVLEQRQQNMPLFQGGFKPFQKNPAKQLRYEKYMELAKLGHKDPCSAIVTSDLTEWEIEHEKDEFHQAYKLYRPLAGMMAMRFTTGGNVDDVQKADVRQESSDTSDSGKAAAMKMYGKMTREVLEWHPDKLVCKRFNVPNPYPGSNIVGLATVKRDKYSVFNFLNFSNPTQQDRTEVHSQHEQSHTPQPEPSDTSQPDSRVDKELNKAKSMKSIFSHLTEMGKETHKSSKPVSFSVKSSSSKPKEFKSIFSHLEKEEGIVKSVKDDSVAMEIDASEKDKTKGKDKSKKDSDLLTKSKEKKDGEPEMDLFRAIFRNTDSEDSSSSEEEEASVAKESSDKMEVATATDKPNTQDKMETGQVEEIDNQTAGNVDPVVGTLPGSGEPMETLSARLSPQLVSDDSDTYGPALPPALSADVGSSASAGAPVPSTDHIDLTKQGTPELIDLTKHSSRKHKHKDKHKHKSKKDKKEKHKKSKHKKKNKKKERKKNKKSDTSDTDTTDKDTDDDEDERATDREILNRLKSMKPGQGMRAADFL